MALVCLTNNLLPNFTYNIRVMKVPSTSILRHSGMCKCMTTGTGTYIRNKSNVSM